MMDGLFGSNLRSVIGKKETALRGLAKRSKLVDEVDESAIAAKFTTFDAADASQTALRLLDSFFICDESGAAVEVEALDTERPAEAEGAASARRRFCAFGTVVALEPAKGKEQPTFYMPGGPLPQRKCTARQRVFLPSVVDWCVEYSHDDPTVWIVTECGAWYKLGGPRWGMDLRPHPDYAKHWAVTARKVEACIQLHRVLVDFLPTKKTLSYRSSFNEALARSEADRHAALVQLCVVGKDDELGAAESSSTAAAASVDHAKIREGGVYVTPAITADFVLTHEAFIVKQLLANDVPSATAGQSLIAPCAFVAKVRQQSQVFLRRKERERLRELKLKMKEEEKKKAKADREAKREERQRSKELVVEAKRSVRRAESTGERSSRGGISADARELAAVHEMRLSLPTSSTWWEAAADLQRWHQRSIPVDAASADAEKSAAQLAGAAVWPTPTIGALVPRYALPTSLAVWELLSMFGGKEMLKLTPFVPEVLQHALMCGLENPVVSESHVALLTWLRDEHTKQHSARERAAAVASEGYDRELDVEFVLSRATASLWRKSVVTQTTWPEMLRQLMLLHGVVNRRAFASYGEYTKSLPAPLRSVRCSTCTVTFCVNPANDLTCSPSYITI